MFISQRNLQDFMGFKIAQMSPEERIAYIRWNALAALAEIHEALDETSWKPWATDQFINTDLLINELRDAFQHMMNMIFAASPHSNLEQLALFFENSLYTKISKNMKRHESGYTVIGTKCPGCRRSYDDNIPCMPAHDEHEAVCLSPSAA